ncbi:MAG: hypothetical protein H6625_00705 [Bdellovibrionaceae bacterium]|nr:hypothetical protein [Pseudobdellovibrionaceae bacterium]
MNIFNFRLIFYFINKLSFVSIALLLIIQIGCSTNGKKIGVGMLAGSAVGAAVGYQFVHHGENKQYESKNTIISSIVFALLTGGFLSWHYQEIEEAKVELSGRFSRYRLCDPEETSLELANQLKLYPEKNGSILQIQKNQIGKLAISLDDNTKWVYPYFRKRYLLPERAEMQVISERYIWEIIKPGSFVTRSQNPQFFIEPEEK